MESPFRCTTTQFEKISIMSKKILIVEDNKLNIKLFEDLLQAHGYKTLQTEDSAEAVALTEMHQPDLILMDLNLPRASGLEITKTIKAKDELKHIPILALTAEVGYGIEDEIKKGGCDGYIAKPISLPKFIKTVADHIN